jgi:hypothetical protein
MTTKDHKLLQKSTRGEVDAFLRKVAATSVTKTPGRAGRLMFAMDATASRQPTWDQACHIQGQMFAQTQTLGGLLIQLCYYRGYGEFHHTPWLSRSSDLLQQMTAVFCRAGHTQIGKVLGHAAKESRLQKLDALVFVGDCVEENVDRLCQLAGELGILGVPTFVFQEGRDPAAERAFQAIAKLTKGAHCPFDANSAHQLRDLLSAVAVYAAGGRTALQAFAADKGGPVKQLTHQIGAG